MKKTIINICLVSMLALVSQAGAGQKIASSKEGLSGRRVEVQKMLGEIREQVLLERSVHEFFNEMGLFDNQLYGRLHGRESYKGKADELKTNIDYLDNQLTSLKNSQDDGQFGPSDTEGSRSAQISQLETTISTMRTELDLFQVMSLLEGGTEVIGGASLDKHGQFGPAPDSFTDPLEKLEYYLKLLESLEQEEKKAEKENADSNN